MAKFTAPQLKALNSAAATGNAWNAWDNVYRASTDRMMKALCAQGLLTSDGRPTDKTAEPLGFAVHGSVAVGAAVISAGLKPDDVDNKTLASVAKRFEGCEPPADLVIPSAPLSQYEQREARVPRLHSYQVEVVEKVREAFLAPDIYTGKIDSVAVLDGNVRCAASLIGSDGKPMGLSLGYSVTTYRKLKPKGHKVRRYNKLTLCLDTWKVIAMKHRHRISSYEAALRQDNEVRTMELELRQYDGLKRTPVRDRRVKRLVKILKTLKRGLYE